MTADTRPHTSSRSSPGGRKARLARLEATQADRQDLLAPSARAKPPPRRMMTPQASLAWTSGQVSSGAPSSVAGSANISTATSSAGVASDTPGVTRSHPQYFHNIWRIL